MPSLVIVDAIDVARAGHAVGVSVDAPLLLCQLYSTAVASDVKLTLMKNYPEDHPGALVHATQHSTSLSSRRSRYTTWIEPNTWAYSAARSSRRSRATAADGIAPGRRREDEETEARRRSSRRRPRRGG